MSLQKTTIPIPNPLEPLSAQNITDIKTKLALENVDNTTDQDKPISTATASALSDKVDKVAGKGLSDENYSSAEKQKLALIEDEATENETDAFLLARANHTGTQASTSITYAINVNNAQGGSVSIDMNIPSDYWNLTSNLVFPGVFLNTPLTGFSKVKNIKITTATGVETVTFPNSWDIYGTFDPTKKNKLSIEVSQTEFLTLDVDVFINKPND